MSITITNSTFKLGKALLSIPHGSKLPDIAIHGSFISGDACFEEREKQASGAVSTPPNSCRSLRILVAGIGFEPMTFRL